MKLIRKITPVLILLVIAFAHVAEASKASRSLAKRYRTANPTSDLQDTSALALWQALKKATPIEYVDVFFGFLGAYVPPVSGAWGALRKLAAFTPFITDVTTVCMSTQLVDDSTPISDPRPTQNKGHQQGQLSEGFQEKARQNCEVNQSKI